MNDLTMDIGQPEVDRLGLQPPAIHPPEEMIVGIRCLRRSGMMFMAQR